MPHPFQDLYDRMPALACKGLCGQRPDHCCGPIGCTTIEADLLEQYDGIRSEWLSLGNGMVHMPVKPPWECPHFGRDGRCQAYEVRPIICRAWGTVKAMRCPHGCRPKRWLTDKEYGELQTEACRRTKMHDQKRSAPDS